LVAALLIVLATGAQLFKAEAPKHLLFYASPVFFFAGVNLLVHPFLLVLLVAVPHLVEWRKERWQRSPHLRAWYLQPFNVAMYIIAGLSARWVYTVLPMHLGHVRDTALLTLVMALAALTYVVLNHLLLGVALVLARGVSWRDSGILAAGSLVTELTLLCVGIVIAALWPLDPWLIVPALAPLVLMYQALMIPKLKQEAQIDAKTGLPNARHVATLAAAEIERAARFNRPLALIMADLDRFKAINDTYGHLAGDAVLGVWAS
jgi:predicted signal transduction protein with EAL and GGDEF domain